MRVGSPTEVPPNFMTRIGFVAAGSSRRRGRMAS
jgi:hypothetical protein